MLLSECCLEVLERTPLVICDSIRSQYFVCDNEFLDFLVSIVMWEVEEKTNTMSLEIPLMSTDEVNENRHAICEVIASV